MDGKFFNKYFETRRYINLVNFILIEEEFSKRLSKQIYSKFYRPKYLNSKY